MHHIEISNKSYAYLESKAKPFVDTPSSVLDRIISDHMELSSNRGGQFIAPITEAAPATHIIAEPDDFPSMLFTSVRSATLAGHPMKSIYWNDILSELIEACCTYGINKSDVVHALEIRTKPGKFEELGFRYVPKADFSYQGLDANRSTRAIRRLASLFPKPLEIIFRWQDNPKANFPGEIGMIVCRK